MLDIILDIGFSILGLTCILLCYTEILQVEITRNKIRLALVYMGLVLCTIANIYCGNVMSLTMCTCIYTFIMVGAICEKNILKSILVYPSSYIISVIISMMCTYIVAMMQNIPQGELKDDGAISILVMSVSCILLGAVAAYNRYKKVLRFAFGKAVYVAMTVGSISFVLIISALQYIGPRYGIPYEQTNLLGFLICCVCIIFLSLFIWLSTARYKTEMYQKEKDMMSIYMSQQEKYIKLIIEKDRDIRKFRHDVRAHMWATSEYMEQGEYKQAKRYLDRIYKEYTDTQLTQYTGVVAVDAIVSEKYREMSEKNISMKWEGDKGILPDKFDIYDICTIIANILNNAIEACETLNEEDRIIKMKWVIKEDNIYIAQENKCDKTLEFDGHGNPVTSKEDKMNHGYGVKNIRTVVEKYTGEMNCTLEDERFRVEIII